MKGSLLKAHDYLQNWNPPVGIKEASAEYCLIRDLAADFESLTMLLADAEMITRSRCREITGKSHHEIALMMVKTPIGKEVAADCAEIATRNLAGCTAAAEIRQKYDIT